MKIKAIKRMQELIDELTPAAIAYYNGEDEIEWNNRKYHVIRVVEPKNKFDIVLVCSKKMGINETGLSI